MSALAPIRPIEIVGRRNNPSQLSRTLLLAITREEKELFLTEPLVGTLDAVHLEWCDPSELSQHDWEALLLQLRPEILVTCWSTPPLPRDPTSIRYVCHLSGSVKHIIQREQIATGLLVSNWGNLVHHSVAEHALLLAMTCLRSLPRWPAVLRAEDSQVRAFRSDLSTQTLRHRRVGIHGFGGIARELIGLLKAFETDIMVFSSGVPRELIESHGVRAAASLEALFSHSQVLFECEALTDSSRGSVTKELLGTLCPDATFINVGRGAVVDEEALAQMAAAGYLRVGLDVFQIEPLPATSLLWTAPCAVLSPHIGGPTKDQYPHCGRFAFDNIRRYLQGDQPHAIVTKEIYDYST